MAPHRGYARGSGYGYDYDLGPRGRRHPPRAFGAGYGTDRYDRVFRGRARGYDAGYAIEPDPRSPVEREGGLFGYSGALARRGPGYGYGRGGRGYWGTDREENPRAPGGRRPW